jgi:thiol-disulfide isomerase/thioredoxin
VFPEFSGEFRTYLYRGDDIDSVSTARFWSENGRVLGTVIHPSGDWGLLEGSYDGDSLRLGRLTGWQAIYVELGRSESGWSGRRYVRGNPPIDMELRPLRADEELVPTEITTMKRPESSFEFACTTLEGDTLSQQDEPFKDRPLVIDIMGTWCHNCMDAAPVLNRMHRDYADEGLQVASLSFELTDDPEAARRNIGLFVDRYDIEYPVLFCGDLSVENVERRLHAQLENFFSYPSTIFMGRDGLVDDIHVGFSGPGTGEELFQEQIEHLEEAVSRIVRTNSFD